MGAGGARLKRSLLRKEPSLPNVELLEALFYLDPANPNKGVLARSTGAASGCTESRCLNYSLSPASNRRVDKKRMRASADKICARESHSQGWSCKEYRSRLTSRARLDKSPRARKELPKRKRLQQVHQVNAETAQFLQTKALDLAPRFNSSLSTISNTFAAGGLTGSATTIGNASAAINTAFDNLANLQPGGNAAAQIQAFSNQIIDNIRIVNHELYYLSDLHGLNLDQLDSLDAALGDYQSAVDDLGEDIEEAEEEDAQDGEIEHQQQGQAQQPPPQQQCSGGGGGGGGGQQNQGLQQAIQQAIGALIGQLLGNLLSGGGGGGQGEEQAQASPAASPVASSQPRATPSVQPSSSPRPTPGNSSSSSSSPSPRPSARPAASAAPRPTPIPGRDLLSSTPTPRATPNSLKSFQNRQREQRGSFRF